MNVLDKLRIRLRRASFQPVILNSIVSPVYIIRRGLFLAIREMAPSVSGNVLDFGCGSKPYESLFLGATSYLGVDMAATGHSHDDSKIDVFYDGKILPFQDGQFDAVVSFEVFEHVFNLQEVLREINRVTRDSGQLMISIPFAWHEHEQPYDFARYTSFGISDILKKGGYEVLETRKTTTHLLAAFQVLISYLSPDTPRAKILRYFRQICVIFPCTLAAYALNAVLPKKYEYFCNAVLMAKKVAPPSR